MASDLSPPAKKAVGQTRQVLIALEAAAGASLEEIANRYRTTPTGVKRSLEKSAREGLLTHYSTHILDSLLPKALAVYDLHLSNGDLRAAKDILLGLGWLSQMPKADDSGKISALTILEVYKEKAKADEKPSDESL